MTKHEELIEKVARKMKPLTARLVDTLISSGADRTEAIKLLPLEEAESAVDLIYTALQDPTEEMKANGHVHCYKPLTTWQSMLNASPLAGEKRGAE